MKGSYGESKVDSNKSESLRKQTENSPWTLHRVIGTVHRIEQDEAHDPVMPQ